MLKTLFYFIIFWSYISHILEMMFIQTGQESDLILERFLYIIWKFFPQKNVGELDSYTSSICEFHIYKIKLF